MLFCINERVHIQRSPTGVLQVMARGQSLLQRLGKTDHSSQDSKTAGITQESAFLAPSPDSEDLATVGPPFRNRLQDPQLTLVTPPVGYNPPGSAGTQVCDACMQIQEPLFAPGGPRSTGWGQKTAFYLGHKRTLEAIQIKDLSQSSEEDSTKRGKNWK